MIEGLEEDFTRPHKFKPHKWQNGCAVSGCQMPKSWPVHTDANNVVNVKAYGICGPCGFQSDNEDDFEIHEVAEDEFIIACKPCVQTLELNEGK